MASASSVPTGGAMIRDSFWDTGIVLTGASMHSQATTIPSSVYIGGGAGAGYIYPPAHTQHDHLIQSSYSPVAISHAMSDSATYDEFLSAVSQQSDLSSDTSFECDPDEDSQVVMSRGVDKPLPPIPPTFTPPAPPPKSLILPNSHADLPVVERKLTILERATSVNDVGSLYRNLHVHTRSHAFSTSMASAHATVAATLAKRNNSLRRMATLNRIHLMQRQSRLSLPDTCSLDRTPSPTAPAVHSTAAVLPPPTLSVVTSLTRSGTARRLQLLVAHFNGTFTQTLKLRIRVSHVCGRGRAFVPSTVARTLHFAHISAPPTRTGSMKHSRPTLTFDRRAPSGHAPDVGVTTLDKHGFIALQDIVATVVQNPGLVLSDDALASDHDDHEAVPRALAMATEGCSDPPGPLVTLLDSSSLSSCPPAYWSTASSPSTTFTSRCASLVDKTMLPSATGTGFCASLGRPDTGREADQPASTAAAGTRVPKYGNADGGELGNDTMHAAKLALLYAIMDTSGQEHVTYATLNQFLSAAIKANGLCIVDSADHARLVDTVLRALDVDGDGNVSFHDFMLVTRKWDLSKVGLPLKRAAVNRGVDMRKMEYTAGDAGNEGGGWGSLRRKSTVRSAAKPAWAHWMHVYLLSHGPNLLCMLLFSLLVFGMAAQTYMSYAKMPLIKTYMRYCVPIAKFCACIVNLSTMFLFLLMCRTLLTHVRSVPYLGKWIPINKHIVWHRYIGILWVVAGLVHGVCHLAGSIPTIVREPQVRRALKLPLADEPVLMAVTSSNAARRAHFERFFYTHHLFIAAVVLLLLHGSAELVATATSWKYIVVPTAVYTCERLARVHRASFKVQVVEASIQADTLVLVMSKPPFLRAGYLAGQYVFVSAPGISQWQWHPFSVTSCGEDEYVSVRIKRVGDWTGDMFALVEPLVDVDEVQDEERAIVGTARGDGSVLVSRPPPTAKGATAKGKQHHDTIEIPPPTPTMVRNPSAFTLTHNRSSGPAKSLADLDIRLDGVFGAPSQSFFEYQQAIFIGTGIGCTPFLSILQQLKALVHAKRARRRRTRLAVVSSPQQLDSSIDVKSTNRQSTANNEPELTRIDFFWLNRDQAGFKWMAETLRNLDPEIRSLLRVHTFLTCAKGGEELASFMLWWGLELVKQTGDHRCLLTGIQDSSVYWGRPDWKSIFEQTADLFPGQKVVFEFVKENF
ncbi:hypothetical protein BCR44DRAFT_1485280 [Catenaria anguillulae PL171]|uniref:Ferric reductase NAD binding domain-domain-containing protein n=1 Tax=Catenaria anguillulae PL171 TaxID=765915 RepID=A0A1Y2HLD4_9FUNG|nr:hypothetical protein BCR44DRAFT_1485280 [Catenaria anguillulae PL171]